MKGYNNSNGNNEQHTDPTHFVLNYNNNQLLEGFNRPISKLQDDIMINNINIHNRSLPVDKKDVNPPLLRDPINHRVKNDYPINHRVKNDYPMDYRIKNDNRISKNLNNNINNRNGNLNKDINSSVQLLPPGSDVSSHLTAENIETFKNDKFRLNSMAQELMDKDESIQKYKNEIYQLQAELNEVKKNQDHILSYDVENKILKQKLTEQHTMLKELSEIKHSLEKEKINSQSKEKAINELKKIIHKQYVDNYSPGDSGSDTGGSSGSDESDGSDSEEEVEKVKKVKKVKYFNHTLKQSLLKQKFSNKEINNIMVKFKITPNKEITKKFPVKIIKELKK